MVGYVVLSIPFPGEIKIRAHLSHSDQPGLIRSGLLGAGQSGNNQGEYQHNTDNVLFHIELFFWH